MSFKIIEANEPLQERPLSISIFGLPGLGKTSASFTMPAPVLHFDFDRGVDRALQKVRPTFVKPDKFGELFNFVMSEKFEIYIEEKGFKSVTIDTIGTLLEDYMTPWLISTEPKYGTKTGGLSLSGWGALSTTFNRFKTRLQSIGLHICMVCHAKEEGDPDKRFELAIKGGSKDIVQRNSDMIGFIHVRGNERTVEWNPTSAHVGKNMAGLPATKIPDGDSASYDNFMATVVQACIDKMTSMSEEQIAFMNELDAMKKKIDKAKKPNKFDGLIDEIGKIESAAMKAQIRPYLKERMDELGIYYSPESKSCDWKPSEGDGDKKEEE